MRVDAWVVVVVVVGCGVVERGRVENYVGTFEPTVGAPGEGWKVRQPHVPIESQESNHYTVSLAATCVRHFPHPDLVYSQECARWTDDVNVLHTCDTSMQIHLTFNIHADSDADQNDVHHHAHRFGSVWLETLWAERRITPA